MNLKKYIKALKIFLIYVIFFSIVMTGFLVLGMEGSLSPLIPTDNVATELLILLLIYYPLSAIIGVIAGHLLLTPVFLFFQKKIVGRGCEYGIEERSEEIEFKKVFRGFFPALLAMNFAILLALIITSSDIPEGIFDPDNSGGDVMEFIFLLTIITGVSMFLFAPVWSLSDGGIVYSNKEKLKDSDQPIEIRSVGSFYMYLLKGYAGIGVIMSFYRFIAIAVIAESDGKQAEAASAFVLLIPFPFLLMLAMIPAVIIFDIIRKQRIVYVRKWARAFGIKDIFNIDIEVLKGAAFATAPPTQE